MLRSIGRTLIGFALIGIAATPAFAQVIGFETGVNLARLSFKDRPGLTLGTRTGPVGGAFFVVSETRRVTAQIDVLFATRGGKITAPAASMTTFRINDLEIPAMVRVHLTNNLQHRVYVLAGPALAIRLDAKADTPSAIVDLNDSTERLGVDLVVGAGVDFSNLTFSGRYAQSLRNLDKTGATTEHHQDVTFIVGFGF